MSPLFPSASPSIMLSTKESFKKTESEALIAILPPFPLPELPLPTKASLIALKD